MEYNLSDEKKGQYMNLIKSAQDVEANIGSAEYRIHKLILLREDVDKALKGWWEAVIKELSLDTAKDYMVSKDGVVIEVEKPGDKPVAPSVDVAAPVTVDDLK